MQFITVPFAGAGAGSGELTWGQSEILPIMQRDATSFSVGGCMPLPAGRTVADVAADLQFVMSRHPGLRTRLSFSAGGQPRQVIAAAGEARLEVVDAAGADPLATATALHRSYDDQPFDWASEWPIRWAVITSGGAPVYLVSVISHLAADGAGVMAMLADLARRDPATGQASGPVTALLPLDLARKQADPAARRQNQAALRYWEGQLATVPAGRFGCTGTVAGPRYRQAFYDSPAAYLAAQVAAARTGTSTSAVLLAAYAVALAEVTGSHPAVIQTVVNNRFRPRFAEMVSPLCNFGLCVIDVAGVSFAEAVTRAWRSSIKACKYAYCDPVQRAALIARAGRDRGEPIDLACFVNDRRALAAPPDGGPQAGGRQDSALQNRAPLPTAADVRTALPSSALSWGYQTDDERERCYLHINSLPGAIQYELLGDTQALPGDSMETLLRTMEATLTNAALDPAAG